MDSTLVAPAAINHPQPSSSSPPVQTSASSFLLDSSTTIVVPTATTVTTTAMKASIATIVPLSNTQHVISLKFTNINYLYW